MNHEVPASKDEKDKRAGTIRKKPPKARRNP
jgi:hypothetical protein